MMFALYTMLHISSLLVVLTTSFRLVGSLIGGTVVSLLIESPAQQHANNWTILDLFKEADNSSVSLSLITLMILLLVAVP